MVHVGMWGWREGFTLRMWSLRVEIFWEFGLDEHEVDRWLVSNVCGMIKCNCKDFGGGDDGRMGAQMVEPMNLDKKT